MNVKLLGSLKTLFDLAWMRSYSSANRVKASSSTGKKLFKSFIYFEIALFAGSYLTWKRMNESQEFRLFMKNNFPSVLEGKLFETFGAY